MRRGVLLLAALAAGCKSAPAPGPAGPQSSVLAVQVRTLRKVDAAWGRPQTVHFVRLPAAGKGDPGKVEAVVASNHTHGNLAYLVNAEPGRYYAVACTEKIDGRLWNSYFPRALIDQTATTLAPGEFAFMGAMVVHLTRTGEHVEPVQQHFMRIIEPDWSRRDLITQLFARSRIYIGTDYRYRREDARAVESVREHLGPSGWADRLR